MKHFYTLIFVLLSNHFCFGQLWQPAANWPSAERDDATGFAMGNFFYVGTGLTNWFAPTADFYKYNAFNDSWQQITGLPQGQERQYACGFAHGNFGFVFGGTRDTSFLNDLWKYDAQSDTWQQMASLPAAGRSGAACFVLADTAYFVAGRNTNNLALTEVWAYNIAANTWQQKSSFPFNGRWRAAATSFQQSGFLLFGKDQNGQYPRHVYQYNPQTDQWTNVAQFPLAGRTHAQFVAQNNALYTLMGADSSGTFYGDVWRFDPQNYSWVQLSDLPAAPRRGGVAFSVPAPQLFYTTGLDSAGNRTNQSWLYYLPISVEENALQKAVKIYPNPTANFIVVEIENESKNAVAHILSLDGKLLFTQVLFEAKSTINVEWLAAGAYFLRVEIGGQQIEKRFVKN